MHVFFILSAVFLFLAAFLWYTQAHRPAKSPSHTSEAPPQAPEIAPFTIDTLTAAVTSLQALMDHPALGGPGFLTIHVSQASAAVTAQYPNIQETLYRRVVRRELSPSVLLAEGVPEALLKLSPEFETESGGMVIITVRISAPDPFLSQALTSHHSRQSVLAALTAELRQRVPNVSIRAIGSELILTPVK